MNQRTLEGQWRTAAVTRHEFLEDAWEGLSRPVKRLPCKYLYDETGARVFEEICQLEEYYPTRTETSILRENIAEIAGLCGPCCNLVELGSGSSSKTRLLLDALERPASYVPIDIAHTQLLESAAALARDYPQLEVLPVCADFTNDFQLPQFPFESQQVVTFFPGSTLGNFEPAEAEQFLRRLSRLCGANGEFSGGLLIGIDLKKEPSVLHAAYNDAQGVTARFNLNILARANRELDADFDLASFQHYAYYNAHAGRIEMHLVSLRPQTVWVQNRRFGFAEGESIVTEHSYKYAPDEFRELAARANFEIVSCWNDERAWFSVQYLRAAA